METGLSITPSFPKDDRATAWSITWYPEHSMDEAVAKLEVEEFAKRILPPGWKLKGQFEQCPETKRYHFQALLKTTQQRFLAVKRAMGNAHVEKARNKQALEQYVQKEKTRVAAIATAEPVPTIWEYQTIISGMWNKETFNEHWLAACDHADLGSHPTPDPNDVALSYVDELVATDIENGRRGAEWIAINPMWRASWRKFWRSIIKRDGAAKQESSSPPADEAQAPASYAE